MKFYVYTSGQDSYEFVTNIEEFAKNVFNPTTMKFTGVMIEAKGPDDAIAAYRNPSSPRGEFLLIDEPDATLIKTKLLQTKHKILNELVEEQQVFDVLLDSRELYLKLHEVNKIISTMARKLHKICDNENITGSIENVYTVLRYNSIKQWPDLFNYIDDGNTKEP